MSKYTWHDLLQLNSKDDSFTSPLSCMAHVDMNAFFAQAEQIRCGYSRDDPVVCVQWNSIIAVSYAARKYGISRLDTIASAMKKANNKLVPVHTAVFRRGEDFWQYHDGCGSWNKDKSKQLPSNLYKVSLDPYRRLSRKIFRIFKKYNDRVEKASVDEVFLDLGQLCFENILGVNHLNQIIEPIPALDIIRDIFENGEYDINSKLPPVPDELRSLKFDGLVYNPDNLDLIEDWDDVVFAIGSQIVQTIRDDIEESLGFTTSAGVARTKYVTKLGSNFRKPNAQTIIPNKSVQSFLDNESFSITSFWTFGGKIGKEICILLKTPEKGSIKFIRDNWSDGPRELHEYLNERLSELANSDEIQTLDSSKTGALAEKLFDISRGTYLTPLNEKPIVKSMMSNKNMRKDSCCNLIHAISWIDVFSGELAARIKELEQEYSKLIIPKTVVLVATTMKKKVFRKTGHVLHGHSEITSADFIKVGAKLMQSMDSECAGSKSLPFYPLMNLSMTISNFEIYDSNKSVIDLFGGQAKVLSKATNDVSNNDDGNRKKQELRAFACDICDITFQSNKDYQEHRDFHVAMKLSEDMNGVTEESRNLSVGEKRLLFNKRVGKSLISKPGNKKNGKSNNNGGILDFFSKR